jgi:hypothetical protein
MRSAQNICEIVTNSTILSELGMIECGTILMQNLYQSGFLEMTMIEFNDNGMSLGHQMSILSLNGQQSDFSGVKRLLYS